jgi:hypothetical protein
MSLNINPAKFLFTDNTAQEKEIFGSNQISCKRTRVLKCLKHQFSERKISRVRLLPSVDRMGT